jgi:hypothetical protein
VLTSFIQPVELQRPQDATSAVSQFGSEEIGSRTHRMVAALIRRAGAPYRGNLSRSKIPDVILKKQRPPFNASMGLKIENFTDDESAPTLHPPHRHSTRQ